MKNPKVKRSLSKIDWVLEITCGLALVMMVFIAIIFYPDLPDSLPQHFDFSGTPDGFGNKVNVWVLLLVTISMYGVLTVLGRVPHLLNYPYPITKHNAMSQYQNFTLMIRILKLLIVLIFFWIYYSVIQIGLENQQGLGMLFLPFAIVSVLGAIVIFIARGFKLNSNV